MILSVSRRTDIPCFYSEWFFNRVQAGYVLTRNPLNPLQITRVPIRPDVVDCMVFWTKDPQNMMAKLPRLDKQGYAYYFQFTITPYGKEIEPNLRSKSEIIETFCQLSQLLGKSRVIWRYDPIIVDTRRTVDFHKEQFEQLCEKLSGYTERVIISFLDLYAKLKQKPLRQAMEWEKQEIAQQIAKTAQKYGLVVQMCCEDAKFLSYGIQRAHCIDRELIEKICGDKIAAAPDKGQRPGCGCCESVDIGRYHTCKNGCIYCYANHSEREIAKTVSRHSPKGEFLIEEKFPGETISKKQFVSYRSDQLCFWTQKEK